MKLNYRLTDTLHNRNPSKIRKFDKYKTARMGLEAIKLELIEWLTKLENEDTIEYLKVVKDSQTDKDWYEGLTPEQKSGIERGLKDIDEGRVTSHEDVKKRFGL